MRDNFKQKKTPSIARWLRDSDHRDSDSCVISRQRAEFKSKTFSNANHNDRNNLRERLVQTTPSRIAVGRTGMGTRYKTATYLKMRADHAIAKDAVYSEIDDEFVSQFNFLSLKTVCKDREDYLLFPGRGRRLAEDSLAQLQVVGSRNCDVQIVVGDGLSAWAVKENLAELLPCLERDFTAAGYSLGVPIFVKFARVGVQDEIGVTLQAKATLILVGERPGLGTGDSLSIYIAYGPKLNQDNAEKNCISNIRKLGLLPHEASSEAVRVLKTAFAVGRGGVLA